MTTHTLKFNRPLANVEILNAASILAHDAELERRQSKAKSDSQWEPLLNQISTQLNQIQAQTNASSNQLKTMSVQLAAVIVNRIIGRSDALSIQRLDQLVDEALNRNDTPLRICLHPDDIPNVQSFLENSSQDFDSLSFVPDDSISSGECRCEYDGYELSSNLDEQIETIEDRLLEAVNE
ncbi:MAG: flagellar biosynthesis/type III secretory pathway protein FliH [Mariniblastus sp.]|jgi:flagellar biosynthesis/type III secretory pathway protein FliH